MTTSTEVARVHQQDTSTWNVSRRGLFSEADSFHLEIKSVGFSPLQEDLQKEIRYLYMHELERVNAPTSIPAYVQWASIGFVVLLTIGLFLVTYATYTGADWPWAGLGIISIWLGWTALTVALYVYGRLSGHHLLNGLVVLLAMIGAIGMLATAAIGTAIR